MSTVMTERISEAVALLRDVLADVDSVPATDDVVRVSRELVTAADLLCSSLVARYASDGSFRDEGFRDVGSWLSYRAGVRRSEGKGRLAQARVIGDLPKFREAAVAGQTTNTHIAMLAAAVTAERLPFAQRDERVLLDAAVSMDASLFQSVLNRWVSLCDDTTDNTDSDDERYEKRRVQLVQLMNGMWRLDGMLDPLAGEALAAAIEAASPKPTSTNTSTNLSKDARTPAQRRHDALADVALDVLSRDERAVVGGQRPHVSLIVHASDGSAHTANNWYVSSFLRNVVMCDCTVTPIGININGQPFYAGTPETDIPLRNRRAVIARDRCCRYPGCDRPARWTDIHHIRERANGGTHELSNLVLLCRFHHRQIHRDELKLEWGADGVTLLVTLRNGITLHGPPHPSTIPTLFDPNNN
jgi:Domain of unknown function (DUF222)/HNH endonuclease